MSIQDATIIEDIAREDRIDSRELVELVERIESDQLDAQDESDTETVAELAAFLGEVLAVISEAEDYSEESAKDGIFLIAVDQFEDYAKELADDIGAVDSDAKWPVCHIDWEAAADALAVDYTEISINGRDFYLR